jgi:hypothetical protein
MGTIYKKNLGEEKNQKTLFVYANFCFQFLKKIKLKKLKLKKLKLYTYIYKEK